MSKAICASCKRAMVPRVIFSSGIFGGWGWRVGGGKPISSCCPFCLSEHWEQNHQPHFLRGSVLMKVLSVPLTLLMFVLLFAVFEWLSTSLGGSALVEWIGVVVTVFAVYKFGRWFVN